MKNAELVLIHTPCGTIAEVNDNNKLVNLLRDPLDPSPYRLSVYRQDTLFLVKITIDNQYIRNICKNTWLVPPILVELFKPRAENTFVLQVQETDLPIAPVHNNFNQMTDPVLFPYQKGNLAWMLELEQRIVSGANTVEYLPKDTVYELHQQNMSLYYDRFTQVLYDNDCLPRQTYRYKGGVLCDEVGLGKTLSMIRLIEHSPQKGPTLILCPRRLVSQWVAEFKKYTTLKPYEMSTVSHVNKYKGETIVVASLSLLENKTYYSADTKLLSGIDWDRLIIDEGHEILRYSNRENHVLTDIFNFRARFKWICTGTPLAYGVDSLVSMLLLLGDKPNTRTADVLDHCTAEQFTRILTDLFHRNTRESIKTQIYVPQVLYQVDYLDFSPTEKAMYSAIPETDVTRKLQICSNISISDKDASIMGGGVILSIDQVNKAMGSHYKLLCEGITADLEGTHSRIATLTAELAQKSVTLLADIASCKNPDELKLLKLEKTKMSTSYRTRLKTLNEHIVKYEANLVEQQKQLQKFRALDLTHLRYTNCPILGYPLSTVETAITTDGCYYSREGLELLFTGGRKEITCPCTGKLIRPQEILYTSQSGAPDVESEIGTWGTKIAHIVKRLRQILVDFPDQKIIIFSRWNKMLKLVGQVLTKIALKHVFCQGNVHVMSHSINLFKTDPTVKIILLSSENCSSGSNLTEASHIFLLDAVNEDKVLSLAINEQAVGRAARLGQKNTVHVYNFIIRDTLEEKFYTAMTAT
jgi:SNF2 family DNA or RNA helicase